MTARTNKGTDSRYFLPTFTIISVVTLLLDQVTKYLSRSLSNDILLTSFLSIAHTTNTGISFGLLKSLPWLPTIVATLVVVGIPIIYQRIPKTWPLQAGSALIFAGAFGNLIDRVMLGAVTDFIAFSFWPTFNIADAAIVIGGALVIIWNSPRSPKMHPKH
ncbi:MAG TPA: signal peptidase II [Candidatus Nanoarchaeia archaeon]|nr:signal peptidase II [Candidatus Nanoarchaeia archaeon]